MKTGLDAAKAITIGANVVGFARTLLQAATESVDDVLQVMEQIEFELKMTMFGVGVDSIEGLRNTKRVSVMGRSLLEDSSAKKCRIFDCFFMMLHIQKQFNNGFSQVMLQSS